MDLILPLSVRSMVCIRPLEVNIQELGSQIKQKRLCYKPFRFCLNYNFIKKITPFEKPSSLPDLHMTYLQQRPSFQEQNFYNRSAVPRDIDYRQMKTKKINILQEVRRTQISEKDFYEKIQSWIEASPERFGMTIGRVMEIIIEKDFSGFQLFKILMNSKLKSKLKLIANEDEKIFYAQFWKTILCQKDAVKIEALKLLGFLTSEYIQNISQQTQIDCIRYLRRMSNLQTNNLNVIRLSLNCIGNILTHSKYKIVDENQEIFYNLYENLKGLSAIQMFDDHNNIRTLSALLRVLNCLHLELKALPQHICEFLVSQLNKYIYLGTHFFPLPSSFVCCQSDNSIETNISTSSSEISESDESEEKKKKDEVCSKIRNYCAACLSNVFRQNTKLIPQYLSTLLPDKVMSNQVTKLLEATKEPLILVSMDYLQKHKKKEASLDQIREDFSDATLLNLLLFEENNKVRLSICKAISAILDGYHSEKSLSGVDTVSQVFKNLSFGVTIAVLFEDDEAFFNHLLRLTATMLAHQAYEKVGQATMEVLIKNVLAKTTVKYQYHTIFLNCISCFSALANGSVKDRNFEELALSEDFNIVNILIKTMKDSLALVAQNKETRNWKQDGVAESTILLESIIALLKFPKHYVEYIIKNSDTIITILEKLQNFDKKFVNVIFKLIEETMKYITNNRNDAEADNEDFCAKEDAAVSNIQMNGELQAEIQRFHVSLEKLLKQIISNVNSENIEFALNILYYLEESHWELYYKDTKNKLIGQIYRINNIQALKQGLLRLLGKICVFTHFASLENFPKIVFNVISMNYPEKYNNIMIKNSWVLANLCANLKNFDTFTVEQNQEILSMILGYCGSSKEKLVSNGFRALGYFISNNADATLCQIVNLKNAKTEEVNKALGEVYLKSFESYSVKVCWNVCVSLSNILKAFKPGFMKLFFREPILKNISQILITKNNFKTQIHCVEMLSLAYDKFPSNPCFAILPKYLANIYFMADEEHFDVSELRYLPHLKESVNDLLTRILVDMSFREVSENLIDMVNLIPHKLLKILYENLHKLYFKSEQRGDADIDQRPEEIETVENSSQVRQRRVETDHQLCIPMEQLNSEEKKSFREYLARVCNISNKFVNLVDSSDEIRVSFAVYESLQELSQIKLDSGEEYLNLELHNL